MGAPSPESGGEWGVLGGTFDPVHNGHLNLAESICRVKKLDGVLFTPSYNHPLKLPAFTAPYSDRVQMLHLALNGSDKLHLCEIEKEQNLSGYTIETLEALRKRFPTSRFQFIIGSDLIDQLNTWHRASELLYETSFLVGSRPGVKVMISGNKKNLEVVEIEELDISASEIRTQIKSGATMDQIRKLVSDGIAEYIFEKGLYK